MNEAEAKLQEKMARIERLETKLSDSIMTVQRADIRLAAIEKTLQELQTNLGEVKALQPSVDKDIDTSKKQIQDLFVNFTNLGALVESFKKTVEQTYKHDESIKVIKESLTDHIDRICKMDVRMKNFPLSDLVSGQITAVHQLINKDEKSLDALLAKQDAQQKALEQAFNSQRSCYSSMDETNGSLAEQIAALKNLTNSFYTAKADLQNKLDKLSAEVLAKIDARIKEKMPSLDVQQIAEATKALIKTDLAFITVDSQNASLKYNNLDKQVALVEKKIESIFLMLKKIELDKATKE